MWLTWRAATQRALYGENGFYLRERPSAHFRTSVSAAVGATAGAPVGAAVSATAGTSAVLAGAVLRELAELAGPSGPLDLVDVGAGEGALAVGVLALAPQELRSRLRVTCVDVAPRPPDLPEEIGWEPVVPEGVEGLVIANEWLDNVPLDVVEQTSDGPRLVMVDPSDGAEQLGDTPEEADLAWLDRWWPLGPVGERAEIGRPRDEAWASVIVRLARGRAVAVDYAHRLGARPPYGSLAGYRGGAAVAPVPDGSCDITAHVALDACAAAGEGVGAVTTTLTTQREALRALGVTGARPSLDLAGWDPVGYLRALSRASLEAELIDPHGLGAFGWLRQSRS